MATGLWQARRKSRKRLCCRDPRSALRYPQRSTKAYRELAWLGNPAKIGHRYAVASSIHTEQLPGRCASSIAASSGGGRR